jgi:hypothetical protein
MGEAEKSVYEAAVADKPGADEDSVVWVSSPVKGAGILNVHVTFQHVARPDGLRRWKFSVDFHAQVGSRAGRSAAGEIQEGQPMRVRAGGYDVDCTAEVGDLAEAVDLHF